jgi:AcrR family transcriptional regulator
MPHMPAEHRRRQLIEAAARVMAEVGLEEATTRMIAAEAGAPLSSLHYTFRDKGELLSGVYEYLLERSGLLLEQHVPEGCGLAAGARGVTLGLFEDALKNESLMAANYEIFFWSIRKQGSRHAAEVYAGYRALCVEALQRATGSALPADTATAMAQFLVNATDGVIIEYLSERDEVAALAHLETFTEIAVERFAPDG